MPLFRYVSELVFPFRFHLGETRIGKQQVERIKQANGGVYLPDEAYTKQQVDSLKILPSDISAGNFFY